MGTLMDPALKLYLDEKGAWVDRELERLVRVDGTPEIPFLKPPPSRLKDAMRYSLMAGGKRLRPILVLAATEACGKPARRSMKTACALEMIHTYSLIHDDLPAMDDDDLRRGKPTNHKVFGEAVAILAGDGLLTQAFDLAAANASEVRLEPAEACALIRVIAAGAGARGMVGGQIADLEAEGWTLAAPPNGSRARGASLSVSARTGTRDLAGAKRLLEYIHTHKTAALITASLEAGAILGGAPPARRRALREYGRAIGLAFQIADDILDVVGEKKLLGKRGSDEANRKLTYARLYGLEESRRMARRLIVRSQGALRPFGARADILSLLADYVVEREK